jgi:hypothetical protein
MNGAEGHEACMVQKGMKHVLKVQNGMRYVRCRRA